MVFFSHLGCFCVSDLDTNNPYLDAPPPLVPQIPESREYRARYRDGDTPGDTWSDIITITVHD